MESGYCSNKKNLYTTEQLHKKNKVFSTLSLIHSFNSIGIKMIKTVTNTCTGGYMYMYFKIALKYHIQPHVCPHYSYVYSFRAL